MVKLINNFAKQNNKYIAFSFDDGPNDTNTINILKTLKKYRAKATFFLIGSRIEEYTVKKNIYEKYNCEIGNHSFMHENFQTNDINSIRNSIIQCQNAISKTFDVVPTLFRAPYGEINDDEAIELLKKAVEKDNAKYDDEFAESEKSRRRQVLRIHVARSR